MRDVGANPAQFAKICDIRNNVGASLTLPTNIINEMKGNDMNNDESRNKLLEYLKSKNLFGVVWYGHFSNTFVTYDFNNAKCPVDHIDIYSAMYEEMFDKYDKYNSSNRINLEENDSWSSILMKLSLEIG